MSYDLQFVDQITASPTVRLNLMAAPWAVQRSTSFGLPELRRAAAGSLMADGERYPAAAYGNRVITLVVKLFGLTDDATATALESLLRELDRPRNFLRYRPGSTGPVFFSTFRAGPDQVHWDPFEKVLTATIPAEPFAYGLQETLTQVAVSNDPSATGPILNANPNFETDASNWFAFDGTRAWSTTQAHEGVASLLLTPSGAAEPRVESERVSVVAGGTYRVHAWVRCAVSRNVEINIAWFTSGGTFVSITNTPIAVVAGTWTELLADYTVPATAGLASVQVRMTGAPPTSHTLHVDEAWIRQAGVSGMVLDVSGVKGDVETPLHLVLSAPLSGTGRLRSGLAVRRRGTPSATPLVLQAYSMTQGTDTSTLSGNYGVVSGGRYSQVTFATQPGLTQRLSTAAKFPVAPSVDARGTYRVFARVRQNTSGDNIVVRLRWGGSDVQVSNSNVTVPTSAQFRYVDLGLIQIPVGYDPVTRGPSGLEIATEGVFLALDARRITGSGTLDVDVLLLWPSDDRSQYVLWPESGTGVNNFWLEGGPTPQVYARNAGLQIVSTQAVEIQGGGLMVSPGVTNRVFFARDLGTSASAGDDITASTSIIPVYWPRYLRPAAT